MGHHDSVIAEQFNELAIALKIELGSSEFIAWLEDDDHDIYSDSLVAYQYGQLVGMASILDMTVLELADNCPMPGEPGDVECSNCGKRYWSADGHPTLAYCAECSPGAAAEPTHEMGSGRSRRLPGKGK